MAGISRRVKRGLIVQQRDLALLRELSLMRVVDREQARLAGEFGSTTRVNTRLLALTRAGLLRRFFLGWGGGRKALYAISLKGAQLAAVPCRGPRRRNDELLVADHFVQHQLAINELYCALKFGTIPVPQVSLNRWLYFHEPIVPGLSLIPDGYLEFRMPAGTLGSFLEVDLGQEPLSIWKEKVRNYLQLALSGEFQKQFGRDRFRVIVLLNSERRLHSVGKTVAAMTDKIFWFAKLDAATAEKFFGPVWLRPVGDTHQPFFNETK
jgi:Replication-relaxation